MVSRICHREVNAYDKRRFHVFRERIEYSLRAIPFFLAEYRETFSEILPPCWQSIRKGI